MAERGYRLSAKARSDLLEIARHTERHWGRRQRNHYLAQLDQAFSLIAENPEIGTSCDDMLPGYRKFPQSAHVIYYRLSDKPEIIRVLHTRMEPDTRL